MDNLFAEFQMEFFSRKFFEFQSLARTKPIKYKKAFIKCKNTIGRRPFRVTKEVTCNKKPKKF